MTANAKTEVLDQGFFLRMIEKDETKLVYFFVGISLAIHVGVFVFDDWKWARLSPPLIDEWVISTELVSSIDLSAADSSSIPDAKKAEEAAAAERLLPQITKKFSIEDAQAKKDEMTIEDEKTVKEEKIEETPVKQETTPLEQLAKDDDESNRLKKDDALKRLALEQLRNEQKKAKDNEAPQKDALARLKAELSKRKIGIGEPGVAGKNGRRNAYQALLQKALQKNFALPEAYNLKNADLIATITVMLNERGDPTKVDVYKSSGDAAFDKIALKTVYDSAPLPPPPPEEVGAEIHVNFTPKML